MGGRVFVRSLQAVLFLLPNILLSQVNILTANYDNSRSNSNPSETILNPSNVTSDTFGKIGSFPVDGQIYAQPLYAGGIPIPGLGLRDVVFAVTMHNSVYAVDAGAPAVSAPLWQVNLGPAVPSSVLSFTDILPEVGILSTPVIDLHRQAIYVVSDTLEGGVPVFRIHALSLADGHEMFNGPVVIAASVPGSGAGSQDGVLQFDASMHLQRPGLALANGMIYAAFGSHADFGDFHGWIMAHDASDLRRRMAVFNASPNGVGGSLWQGGRAPAIDGAGNIFVVTGNGDFDGQSAFGDSVIKLSGSDLSVLDWFTPSNFSDLSAGDLDLGSAGAVLMPGANQVLTGGKSGDLLLLNSASMGHLGPWHSSTAQSFTAVDGGSAGGIYNVAIGPAPRGYNLYTLVPCGPLQAYQIVGGVLDSTLLSQTNPETCTLFSGIALSTNNNTAGTGIVWQTTADFAARQIPGALHAFDAADLTHELWNSNMVPDRDTLGRFAKFVAPTVANGRVYVPTFSNRLDIYGLLSSAVSSGASAQLTAVANSASLLQGAISPGEVVTIFGADIGPPAQSNLEFDGAGQASRVLAGTQVLFNGIAAPLLYTSSGEVGAVAPFGITGPAAEVQVLYRGGSALMTIPIAPAAPALFSLNGTGGGPGAILNEDGTPNSDDNPARPGSVVSLFGTGLGPTNPLSEDGTITSGPVLPTAVLPVTVLIDGQPAEILYAGDAPGMLHGFVQVNVRIPSTITVTGTGDLSVVLKAGDYASPTVVTVSVAAEPSDSANYLKR